MDKVCRTILCGVAASAAVAMSAPSPALAQVYYHFGPSYDAPYGPLHAPIYFAPRYSAPRYLAPMRASPLPPREIVNILMDDHRFTRVGQPRFAGHIYTVDGIDRSGAIVRVYVDSFNGRIIDADTLQPAPRHSQRFARLPRESEPPRATPLPPRRPEASQPRPKPEPRTAARPPSQRPDAPTAAPRSMSPAPPLIREPRVVDPSQVRVPQEADRQPPLARGSSPSASGSAGAPSAPAPGASPVAPAPLDDASRRPALPPTPDVPVAPLF